MNLFTVAFAGSTVTLLYDTAEALEFLSLLFLDVAQPTSEHETQPQLSLLCDKNQNGYQLHDGNTLRYRGRLGVKCAACTYDTVIFHLLNRARDGIALHAGGVISNDRVIILPGPSGSGKSTLTVWLASKNCSYLTDELIFISLFDPRIIEYFSRPLCLKPGSLHLLENMLGTKQTDDILLDGHGAVMPHRLLASDFKEPLSPPSMIILPDYRPGSTAALESVSRARLATQLMGCHVNARNLADHGFKQVFDIARSTPAYRLTYNNLQDAENLLNEFL